MKDPLLLESYNYVLDPSYIAQFPHDPVDQCKLMVIDKVNQTIEHQQFDYISSVLNQDYILFFNNSKVVKARILLDTATVEYQGNVIDWLHWELFYLWPTENNRLQFLVKPWSKLKVGAIINIGNHRLSIVDNFDYGRIIQYDGDIFAFLEEYWQMPLPPYVHYSNEKESDYQPPMATIPWSVASPTACLHFSQRLLDSLESNGTTIDYVTLHVGLGTFKSIDTKNIEDYHIHCEASEIDIDIFERIMNYKLNKQTILAVGTTSTRTLESLPYLYHKHRAVIITQLSNIVIKFRDDLISWIDQNNSYIWNISHPKDPTHIQFECCLYITPWFQFRIIDQLITNFHLPKSSLMVLLASFMGYEFMMQSYDEAIKKNYRFYSFGDAMRIS